MKPTTNDAVDPTPRMVARVQGWFYALTGAWPLASGATFQWVTGFKTDFWLVQLVGALLFVSGIVLILAARFGRVTPEIFILGCLQAIVLAVFDVYCVQMPGTTWVYWMDALVEVAFAGSWLCAMRVRRKSERR